MTTSLPTVLATAPWAPVRKRKKLVLETPPPRPERLVTREDAAIREQARTTHSPHADDRYAALSQEQRDEEILTLIASRGILPIDCARYLSEAALVLALERAELRFIAHYRIAQVGLERFGLAMIEPLVQAFGRAPGPVHECLRDIDSPRVAALYADKTPAVALEWFQRHPETAGALLVPIALTGATKEAARARKQIATLVREGHEDALFRAARSFGEDAAEELRILLLPPTLPSRPPTLPTFFDPRALPAPRLRDGAPLATEHVERLGQLLALLPLEAARTAVSSVRDACEDASLGDFARALVERWVAAEAPTKEKWVLLAAALLGDDLVAHQLATNIATWAGEGHHTRSAAGVEALRELGTDVALAHLARFAEKSKVKPLKKRARLELDAFREEHDLDEDALADRLVPDLGFDARGGLTLSYGPRAFQVMFDESLKAALRDGDRPLRSLPKASASDDAALADRAQATWAAVKTESKALVEGQVRRLERAMCKRRRWSSDAFTTRLHRHPLLQHVARRLVWGAFDGQTGRGALLATFRIAEDGSLSGPTDATAELLPGAQIGIAHALDLGVELAGRWGELFGDYEIVQPFPQLAREVRLLTAAEQAAATLDRFAGTRVEGSRFFGLRHRGWEPDYGLVKRLASGHVVTLVTMPGVEFLASKPADQLLGSVKVSGEGEATFGALDVLEASEMLRDLEMLTR